MPPAREKSLEKAARNRTHVIAHLFIRLDIGRAGLLKAALISITDRYSARSGRIIMSRRIIIMSRDYRTHISTIATRSSTKRISLGTRSMTRPSIDDATSIRGARFLVERARKTGHFPREKCGREGPTFTL